MSYESTDTIAQAKAMVKFGMETLGPDAQVTNDQYCRQLLDEVLTNVGRHQYLDAVQILDSISTSLLTAYRCWGNGDEDSTKW